MKCTQCGSANDEGVTHCFTCGASLGSTTVIKKGAIIAARYEIQETLGKGGMGTVYKAYDHILDEQIALKVLRPDMVGDQDMARRFRLEIKLARKVRHKNVCGIHEYGEEGGLRFIAMEYLTGVDLRKVLNQRGTLPMAEAFDVSIAVALGLQAIHEAGIIHRDLKTPNIMIDTAGQVRLMDFGIAKQSGSGATLSGTAMGMIVGTPEYMSPEQGRGEKVDFRSDVYALGVVIYEIFTGNVPFRGETPIATIFKHLQEPPPLTGPRAERLPGSLVPVLAKTLAKAADDRYASVAELAESLKQARTEALAAAPALGAVQGTVVLKVDPSQSHRTPSPTAVPTSVHTAVRTLSGDDTQRQREQVMQDAITQIERALSRGALDEAAAALGDARTRLSDPQALGTLSLKLDEARRLAEQAKQRAAQDAQKRAEQERLRAEEAQRQKLRAAALAQIEQLLRNGELEGATKALADAVVAYGPSPDLSALSGRIDKARQKAAEEHALSEMLQSAETLLSAREFEKAHQAAEQAVKRAPNDSRARALLTRIDGEWRTHAVAEANTRVRAAMEQGSFDQAEAQLRDAEQGLGKATFKALRKDLESRRTAARKTPARAEPPAEIAAAAPRPAAAAVPDGSAAAVKMVVAAAALFAVVAGGILWWMLSPKAKTEDVAGGTVTDTATPAPPLPGGPAASVIIDAVPWGEVTEIVDAAGKPHTLGQERFTPLLVQLPAGEYTISVKDPAGAAPTRLKVSVPASGSVVAKAEFRPIRAEDYFSRVGFK